MNADSIWIISIAMLVGISCALVGCFLVLRRLAMLGDAISHSVLFGIVIAFLLSGSRSAPLMMVGAIGAGLLTAYLTQLLHHHGRLQEDASIGVTFTWLFALGVILISAYAGQVDLDQECVLYGEIAFAPLDTITLFGIDIGPRSFWMIAAVTVLAIILIVFGMRSLRIVAFDPVLAASLGIPVVAWHYLLMTMVSLATVASFEAVGAILVVAMLVIPANTAYLLATSVRQMLLLACSFAAIAAVGGYFIAVAYNGSVSAAMAMVSGVIFAVVLTATKVRSRIQATSLSLGKLAAPNL